MSWTITGNPVALCDTQHAGKEIVTRPMSGYFANDPECHDLLPCALRSHWVAGLWGCPTEPPVGGVTSTSTPALCGPVALYLLQWPRRRSRPVWVVGVAWRRGSTSAGFYPSPGSVLRFVYLSRCWQNTAQHRVKHTCRSCRGMSRTVYKNKVNLCVK